MKQLSSTCHVSFLAASDTDHKHKFSLTHLIYLSYLSDSITNTHKNYGTRPIVTLRCSTAEWRINTNHISHSYEPRKIELCRNLVTDPYQKQKRIIRNNYQNPITEDMDEFGKVGAESSYLQSQVLYSCDSAESTADSDLEDGGLRNMLASSLWDQLHRGNLLQ